jgi:hypothetical protein
MLIVFLVIFPFAALTLFVIAIHVDPLTGHFRGYRVHRAGNIISKHTMGLCWCLFCSVIIQEISHHILLDAQD